MKIEFLTAALFISLLPQPSRAEFVAHEWGTFTSVQGSNGEALPGLQKEEEALPSFIHNGDPQIEQAKPQEEFATGYRCTRRCDFCSKGACLDAQGNQPLRVTQKMETPVLYFYSQTPRQVDVTVDFPQGVISQYYPQASSLSPNLGQAFRLSNGSLRYFGLEILTQKAAVPAVSSGNVYAPARETRANLVRSLGETEKFIFYRGLGDFRTSLKITSDSRKLSLRDTRGRGIPYLLAVNIRDGKGSFKVLGALEQNQTLTFDLGPLLNALSPVQSLSDFERSVGPELVAALERSGLYPDEARAMVNTWRLSYFHTEGLRVLYILPRAETDELLPLRISPQPDAVVRTLVGRVEVLTQLEEETLLSAVQSATIGNKPQKALLELGRFAEPKLLRIAELTADKTVKNYIQQQIH